MLSNLFDTERHIYGFDSFHGLPKPSPEDDPQRNTDFIYEGRFGNAREEVIARFLSNGISPNFMNDHVTLIEGWFSDTLHRYDGRGIALLHLDVDMYESYKQTLEYFYPKVNKGGVIAFDEYQDPVWVGATKAIDEFFDGKEKIVKSPIFRFYVVKDN